jgi:hypothetical protein
MITQLNSTLPERQPKRASMFSIRLTEAEQDEIDTLAKRLNLPNSFMARHFILEAVKHHKSQFMREEAVEA